MTEDGRRRVRSIATLVGAVLGVIGVLTLVLAFVAQQPAPPSVPDDVTQAAPRDSASAQPAERDQSTRRGEPTSPDGPSTAAPSQQARPDQGDRPGAEAPLEMDYAEPTRVVIPTLGVSSRLEDLGLAPDGAMEVPVDPDKAGWFTPSVPPGVVGASVIAGHVTWDQEPVVFFRLGELRKGDVIRVKREDGSTAVFRVDRIGQFPKDSFPTAAVYDQPHRPNLRLITCGGEFDYETNHYLDNVIVWASLADTRPPPA